MTVVRGIAAQLCLTDDVDTAQADYPFFTTVNRVLNGQLPPSAVVEYRKSEHCAPTPNDNDDKTWMDVSSVPAGAVAK